VLIFLQPGLTGMRVDIFGDNEVAKAIADNPGSASRSRHIDVKLHFIRGLDSSGRRSCVARGNRRAACRYSYETSLEEEVYVTS